MRQHCCQSWGCWGLPSASASPCHCCFSQGRAVALGTRSPGGQGLPQGFCCHPAWSSPRASGWLVAPWPLGVSLPELMSQPRDTPCPLPDLLLQPLVPVSCTTGDQSSRWPCPPCPPGHPQGLSCSGKAGGGREPVPVVVETLEYLTRHFVWCHQLKVRHSLAGQGNE